MSYFDKLKCEVISPRNPVFSDSLYILKFSCKPNVDISVDIKPLDSNPYPPSRCRQINYVTDHYEIKFAPMIAGKYNIFVFLGDKDDPTQSGRDGSYSLDLEYTGPNQRIGFPYISSALEGGLKIDEPLSGFLLVGKNKFKVWAPKALGMAIVDFSDYRYLEKKGEWFQGEIEIKRPDVDIEIKVHMDPNDNYDWFTVAQYTSYQ